MLSYVAHSVSFVYVHSQLHELNHKRIDYYEVCVYLETMSVENGGLSTNYTFAMLTQHYFVTIHSVRCSLLNASTVLKDCHNNKCCCMA